MSDTLAIILAVVGWSLILVMWANIGWFFGGKR